MTFHLRRQSTWCSRGAPFGKPKGYDIKIKWPIFALSHHARQTLSHRMVASLTSLLILSRGNKKQAKKQTKSKKEVQRELRLLQEIGDGGPVAI